MLQHAYPKNVTLRGNRQVVLRPLGPDDFEPLCAFFHNLPEDDRTALRDDVTNPELIRRWVANRDMRKVIPIVALDGKSIVADGTLHLDTHGWMMHVGEIRIVTAASHRRLGLGAILARELVALAEERGLEKLQARVIEDALGTVRMFQRIGFKTAAVIPDLVKDLHGNRHNVAVMVSSVRDLDKVMEDWFMDAMIPSYRMPGGGDG